jgi:hypothetical protein
MRCAAWRTSCPGWRGARNAATSGKGSRAESYACITCVAGCGEVAIKAELLEESVTCAVLDALEFPRVQEALRDGAKTTMRRTELLA